MRNASACTEADASTDASSDAMAAPASNGALYIAPASWPRAPGPGVPISQLFPEEQDIPAGTRAVRGAAGGAAEGPTLGEATAEGPAASPPGAAAPPGQPADVEELAQELAQEILSGAPTVTAPAGSPMSQVDAVPVADRPVGGEAARDPDGAVAASAPDDEAWQRAAAALSPLGVSSESSDEADRAEQPILVPPWPTEPKVGQLYLVSSEYLRPLGGRPDPQGPPQMACIQLLPKARWRTRRRTR